jgi:diguanylate cyclase (GGDEF)-like protein
VDADHFKDINTRYFLSGGDSVLVALAKTLCSSVRGVDTIGRTGGEEFLVVAPETDEDGAHGLGERIRSAVEQMEVLHQGERIKVTVSVGLTVASADCYLTPEQLIHEAAVALDQAKSQGRNCVVVRSCERGGGTSGESKARQLVGQA